MSRLTLALLTCAAALSGAQVPIGIPSVDSATAARAAWSRAVRADDLAVSRREVDRAAAAWPTQPTYVWSKAVFAARSLDTAGAFAALGEYADLGLGRDLAAAPELAFLRTLPTYSALAARHDARRGPLVRSEVVSRLQDSTFWPEGVDYDPVEKTYYLAGIRHGTIARLDTSGKSKLLWPGDSLRRGAVMGVRVDAKRRVLWATTSGVPQNATFQPADTALASLLKIDLTSGRVIREWHFPVAGGGHVLGDAAIGPDGDVWISDSIQPLLYRLRSGPGTLETYRSPLFRSLQGVVVAPNNSSVFIADYSHGLLLMDLPSGRVSRLADAPHSTSLGCDGLAWYRGSIIAVQNGVTPARIVRFHLKAGGRAIERVEVIDRNTTIADEPTIGTIVGNRFVYVANSQWEKHDERGRKRPEAKLTEPVLLGVPLR